MYKMASNTPPQYLPSLTSNQLTPAIQPPYQHFISQQGQYQSLQQSPWSGPNQQVTSQQNDPVSQSLQPQVVIPPPHPQQFVSQQEQIQSGIPPTQHFVSPQVQSPPLSSPVSQHFIGQQEQSKTNVPPYQHFIRQTSKDAPGPPLPKPAFGNEVVSTEEDEDVAQATGPPKPSAPDPSNMDHVTGYESVGFNDSFIPPPSYQQTVAPKPDGNAKNPTIPEISEDEARQALLCEVEKHCCYGKKAARELVFTNITPHNAFHYQLETFTERRSTNWTHEPYNGQFIDGPQNGPAPGPWNITAQPNQLFQDHEKHFEVPHTASIKTCHNCVGAGMTQCWRCRGRGTVVCRLCHGSGRREDYYHHHRHHHHHHHHNHNYGHTVRCYQCDGTGYRRCWTCHGCGRIECSICHTKCKLKWYIKLTVIWKTHKADHIVERTALPDHLIRNAEGKRMFQDQQPTLYHIHNFPENEINEASKQLIESHANTLNGERVLKQRHWIRNVPVSQARCDYKEKSFSFFVYGYNTLVYAPEYPQKICCGCTIT